MVPDKTVRPSRRGVEMDIAEYPQPIDIAWAIQCLLGSIGRQTEFISPPSVGG